MGYKMVRSLQQLLNCNVLTKQEFLTFCKVMLCTKPVNEAQVDEYEHKGIKVYL